MILIRFPSEYFLNRPETDGSSLDVVVYDDGDDDVDHNDVSNFDDDDDDDCVVLCFLNAI